MNSTQTRPAVSSACWSCRAAAGGAHFCPACGKVQPLVREADYFAFFGLPIRLGLDPADLEARYHQLSWKLHPDNFVRASEYERTLSLDRASQLNDAYRTLRNPISRVEYLLALHGMRKEGQTKQQAPPELLEEVFELNESLDELRMARPAGGGSEEMAALRQRLEAAERSFEERLKNVDTELDRAFREWDAVVDASTPAVGAGPDEATRKRLMAHMNEILNRRSYIRNLVANVQKELAES